MGSVVRDQEISDFRILRMEGRGENKKNQKNKADE